MHAKAKLTPFGRPLLVQRVQLQGWSATRAAETLGVSRATAYKWIARFAVEGERGLTDRSSRPELGLKGKAALEDTAMPVYEFKCGKCEHLFEVMGSYAEREKAQTCPKCGGTGEACDLGRFGQAAVQLILS